MNTDAKRGLKKSVLFFSTLAIAVLHFSGLHGSMGLHGVHRELFFIPILLASFWFGLRVCRQSLQPQPHCSYVHESKIGRRQLVVSCCNPSKLF